MPVRNAPDRSFDLSNLMRMERLAFAAKVRLARAVAGLSQSELAARIGMTQRSIHKLEQGGTEPRRATVVALEMLWREKGIEFEDLVDGGFRAVIRSSAFEATTSVHRPHGLPLGPGPDGPSAGYRT
ncbi:helix-turn-helix domain-containing protein [Undibacter mobilis]|uniref:XRE family transcriptional regulator n=1 Tax=Undibacter mobilis TaxID=2292256 RepID=A0A371B0B4_9BRAD|nr:helix-turn-helix transcriptional regulator [Undibacter mobilis]RDV01039.1 XRE family transcriptional regulator [Undibacter mobilis]